MMVASAYTTILILWPLLLSLPLGVPPVLSPQVLPSSLPSLWPAYPLYTFPGWAPPAVAPPTR